MVRASPPSRNRSATIRKPLSIALSSASLACRRRRGAGRSVQWVLVVLLLAALKYFRRSLELSVIPAYAGIQGFWHCSNLKQRVRPGAVTRDLVTSSRRLWIPTFRGNDR